MSLHTYTNAENTHCWGEVSLSDWSPVVQVWINLLQYIQITSFFLVKSSLVKLETSHKVIFPTMVIVLTYW